MARKSELKTLFHAKPATPEQEKARDFFFFSYSCNGMNMKDIALLQYSDIQQRCLTFYRAKTIHTSKHNLKPVQVFLTDFALEVIQKYGNTNSHPDNYIFSIVAKDDTPAEQRRKIQNFTRFVNQHLKKLAVAEGLPEDISTYYARHSFATNAIQEGASMEMVMEALSHADVKTTKNYFAGFEVESKRDLSQRLMNF